MAMIMRMYLDWQNRRRDKAQGVHLDAEKRQDADVVDDDHLTDADETDVKNKQFRYVL